MKFTLIFSIFLSSSLANAAPLQFIYQPSEMDSTVCTHEQIRDLPDWKVVCKTPYGTKEFAAHVIVRESQREEEPKTSLEVLYWVTQRNEGRAPAFHSATSIIRLTKGSSIASMRLSQSVENDYASLVMDWQP